MSTNHPIVAAIAALDDLVAAQQSLAEHCMHAVDHDLPIPVSDDDCAQLQASSALLTNLIRSIIKHGAQRAHHRS